MSKTKYEVISPKVNPEAEFFEILNDFSDPLEIIREAISNSIDWGSSFIKIKIFVEHIEGERSLIIEFSDDGLGMNKETISNDFWGLGFSKSRGDDEKIGEKGHGTKIFLRSRKIHVISQSNEGTFEAICERPLARLCENKLHEPKVRTIEKILDTETGTVITVYGYNENESSKFIQSIVKDYIIWFTKIGSVEIKFGITKYKDFKVYLQCIDKDEYEEITFGHVFPKENPDINELFEKYDVDAADKFVKKYVLSNRLTRHPEVTFDAVIYVEGDDVKREYNPMIKMRKDERTGAYKVSDRYGIWLCKDFIPVQRVNEWITGFGSGSNAFVLLHGFVNCQNFKLTANRGNISNTDPQILNEIEEVTKKFIDEIDEDIKKNSLYVLRNWQDEIRTIKQEQNDFKSRVKLINKKKFVLIGDEKIYEPMSESELFGNFIKVYTLRPTLFEFEPIDYNTNRGIDIIAKIKGGIRIAEGDFGYVELKYILRKDFNHAFQYLKWIVCWDFHPSVVAGTEFIGVEENDVRYITFEKDDEGHPIYFLEKGAARIKIQIIRLKELLENKLGLEFT